MACITSDNTFKKLGEKLGVTEETTDWILTMDYRGDFFSLQENKPKNNGWLTCRLLTEEEKAFAEKIGDALALPEKTTKWTLYVPHEDIVEISVTSFEFDADKLKELVEE